MYVFPPYTPVDKIESSLGFEWRSAAYTGIERDDGACLLVFVRGSEVVQYCRYRRDAGDFAALGGIRSFTPESAVFRASSDVRGGSRFTRRRRPSEVAWGAGR
jgi:hypothetical protein